MNVSVLVAPEHIGDTALTVAVGWGRTVSIRSSVTAAQLPSGAARAVSVSVPPLMIDAGILKVGLCLAALGENVPPPLLVQVMSLLLELPLGIASSETEEVAAQTVRSAPAFTPATSCTLNKRFALVADPQAFVAVTETFLFPVVWLPILTTI